MHEGIITLSALCIVGFICVVFVRLMGFQNAMLEKVTTWLIGMVAILFLMGLVF